MQIPNTPNSPLLHLYLIMGHIYMCTRNLALAITNYLKAYKIAPQDPLISLLLGVAHLNRGMQARSENRHEHILRCFTFLCQYERITPNFEESQFNMGRAMHQIGTFFVTLGLLSLAIPYYERVMKPGGRYEKEAAYNMATLYVSTGSNELAHVIYRKHLSL